MKRRNEYLRVFGVMVNSRRGTHLVVGRFVRVSIGVASAQVHPPAMLEAVDIAAATNAAPMARASRVGSILGI